MNILCALVALLSLSMPVFAQVVKCKDASGKVTYSDRGCAGGADSSSVNTSGGNIIENQNRQAQVQGFPNQRVANSQNCQALWAQSQMTFASFEELSNRKRWEVAIRSLETLAGACPSKDSCELIGGRVNQAQARYIESNSSVRGSQLTALSALYAERCMPAAVGSQVRPQSSTATGVSEPSRSYWTKDQFGNSVRSNSCYWTKDQFGTPVRSAGCAKD
jgi:Domain of unknown function (DUF4124)